MIAQWLPALLLLLLAGCATTPPPAPSPPLAGERLVLLAREMLGLPYRYGGASPKEGFDCSGLVFYLHRRLGIAVPRTAREQFLRAEKVSVPEPGDLLFFRLGKGWHVGIYEGRGRFIHAPTSRGRVRRELLNGFWKRRWVGTGRFWKKVSGGPSSTR